MEAKKNGCQSIVNFYSGRSIKNTSWG